MIGITISALARRVFGPRNAEEIPTPMQTIVRQEDPADAAFVFRSAVTVIAGLQGIDELPSVKAILADAEWASRGSEFQRHLEGISLSRLLARTGDIITVREAPSGRIIPLLELLEWLIFNQTGQYSYDAPVKFTIKDHQGLEVLTDKGRIIRVPECTLLSAPHAREIADREQARAVIELLTQRDITLTSNSLRRVDTITASRVKNVWNSEWDLAVNPLHL